MGMGPRLVRKQTPSRHVIAPTESGRFVGSSGNQAPLRVLYLRALRTATRALSPERGSQRYEQLERGSDRSRDGCRIKTLEMSVRAQLTVRKSSSSRDSGELQSHL